MNWKPTNIDWRGGEHVHISPELIEQHEECQPRMNGINKDVVQEYANDMREYDEVYRDRDIEGWQKFDRLYCIKTEDERYILVSGFHRLAAINEVGYKEIQVYYKKGTFQDAVVLSKKENANNGIRRSNADKEHVVLSCLLDPELRKWSNEHIAEWCGVAPNTVKNHENRLSANCRDEGKPYERPAVRFYMKKDGTVGQKDTTKIGKREATFDVESLTISVKRRIAEGHYRQSITDLVYAEFKDIDIDLEHRQDVVRKIYDSIIARDTKLQMLQAFWDTCHKCYKTFCESEFAELERINDVSWTRFIRAAWEWSNCDFLNVDAYMENPRAVMIELSEEQINMMRGQYTLFTQALVSGEDFPFMETLRKSIEAEEQKKQNPDDREANSLLKKKTQVFKQMWDKRKQVAADYIGDGDTELNQTLCITDLEKAFPKLHDWLADAFRSALKRTSYSTYQGCLDRVLESDVSVETLNKELRAISTYAADIFTWNGTTKASQWVRDLIAQNKGKRSKTSTPADLQFLETVKKVSGLETSKGTKIDTQRYESIRLDFLQELSTLETAQKNGERLREDKDDVVTLVAKKHEVNESVIRHIDGMENGISLSLISVYFSDNHKDEFVGADFCPNGEPDTHPLLEWIPEELVKQLEKIGHIAYLNELNEA